MTLLAVPIMVQSLSQGLAAAVRAAEQGADLVEFRIDRFIERPQQITQLVERADLPCIITCRLAAEGGEFTGNSDDRLPLYAAACAGIHRPAYLDVELAAYHASAGLRAGLAPLVSEGQGPNAKTAGRKAVTTGLILSTHDFATRPADLYQRLQAMADNPIGRVVKVAWRARSLRDNIEAFEILADRHKPTIALCMGEAGLPSRVLARKFGALLTFASLDDQTGTAPGQLTVQQMKTLYRWDRLGPRTQVLGVIGHPVAHSMSPAIHNAGFGALEFDGVYLPLPIPPEYEHFKATLLTFLDAAGLDFRGASVTLPHKENLLRFVRERIAADGGVEGSRHRIEPLAERIGAANTLTVSAEGALYASNSDYAAALDATCAAMGIDRQELGGVRVGVLGAGGAARAVVAGFAQYGASVTIFNRTMAKAQALAHYFQDLPGQVTSGTLEQIADAGLNILVNCTPVGMHPKVDQSPVAVEVLAAWAAAMSLARSGPEPDQLSDKATKDRPEQSVKKNPTGAATRGGEKSSVRHVQPGQNPRRGMSKAIVFDTIYNPVQTRLLRDAKAAGLATISGTEMFVRQAAVQFKLWTQSEPPIELFRRVLMENLGSH